MSHIVQYQKKSIDDAFDFLRRGRQQDIVMYTPGREPPRSQSVAPLTPTELVGRLQKQAEEDTRIVQAEQEYFESLPGDQREYGLRPELANHEVPLLEYAPRCCR